MSKWKHPIPVWVSRKDADGMIAKFTMPLWWFFAVGLIVVANVTVWSIIGLIVAAQWIVGAL